MALAIIIGRLTGERLYSFGQILTETFRISLLNNFAKYPKLTIHNLIIFGIIHYYFYINMYFQSQYTSVLMKKIFMKDIDTIQELYDSQQEIYGFINQIEEIEKIYSGTNYSDIVQRFRPIPQFGDLWELNRDAIYKFSVSEYILRAFIINHDRAVFLSRSRVYRKNGKLT